MVGMSPASYRQSAWFRWGPAVLIMALIFLFSSIPSSGLPSFGNYDLLAKKGGHFLGYALLALAYRHGIGAERPGARRLAWLFTVLYAVTDEIHQAFVPGRGPWAGDVGIDGLGAALSLVFTRLVR